MSNNSKSTAVSYGIGFPGALFITFLVLKLTHVIDWSWWWIFSPIWIDIAIAVLIVIIVLISLAVTAIKMGLNR